jgi:RES domain
MYEERVDRSQFLEGFHALIARPIQPHEEPLEYIPTQAVAEYVANVLSLDGILYASAQLGSIPDPSDLKIYINLLELTDEDLALHNVVLFGAASRVDRALSSHESTLRSQSSYESRDADALTVAKEALNVRIIQRVSYTHSLT